MRRLFLLTFVFILCPVAAKGYSLSYNSIFTGGYDSLNIAWSPVNKEISTWRTGNTWFYMPEGIFISSDENETDSVLAVISCAYYIDYTVGTILNDNFSEYDVSFSIPYYEVPEKKVFTIPINETIDLYSWLVPQSLCHIGINIEDFPVPIDPELHAFTEIYGEIKACIDIQLVDVYPITESSTKYFFIFSVISISLYRQIKQLYYCVVRKVKDRLDPPFLISMCYRQTDYKERRGQSLLFY